jgi:hypothetical protein
MLTSILYFIIFDRFKLEKLKSNPSQTGKIKVLSKVRQRKDIY